MLSVCCGSTFGRGGMSLILSRASADNEESTTEGEKDTRRAIFFYEMYAMNGTMKNDSRNDATGSASAG